MSEGWGWSKVSFADSSILKAIDASRQTQKFAGNHGFDLQQLSELAFSSGHDAVHAKPRKREARTKREAGG